MKKTGLTSKLWSGGGCVDTLHQPDHSQQTAIISITHGRLLDHPYAHKETHTKIRLAVSNANIALVSAYRLIEQLESFEVVIETLHGMEDAQLWLMHLARLRARSMRSKNHFILLVETENEVHLSHNDWLAYNEPF